MKFYFISNLVVFVAVTVQQRFFFFFLYGVSTMESSGENFVNFVWNEKSYSSNIYIYIYI
jgi:hypothetical protein